VTRSPQISGRSATPTAAFGSRATPLGDRKLGALLWGGPALSEGQFAPEAAVQNPTGERPGLVDCVEKL